MWSFEEIETCNSDHPLKLRTILRSSAARESQLSRTADELEVRGSPWIACFAQLPFPLSVNPSDVFNVPVGRYGASASLRFSHFRIEPTPTNNFSFEEIVLPSGATVNGIGTQVGCFMTLWGRHAAKYGKYLECVTETGLNNRILNAALWGRRRAPADYSEPIVNADEFEHQATSSVRTALEFAIRIFLDAYSVVAIDDVLSPKELPGFFAMLAPGRVNYIDAPESPVRSMTKEWFLPNVVSEHVLQGALQFRRRELDDYLGQVIAMKHLARQGEARLAVVGCVTAIEWFLNSLVDNWKPGDYFLPTGKALKRHPLLLLPDEMKHRLVLAAETRNDIVHAVPIGRNRATDVKDVELMGEIAALAVDLYREIQARRRA
jgi:hypothetical protein